MIKPKKLIIISGVTGVGKSKIAFELAKKLNSEILLLDIFQTYKQLNICSNKPPSEFYNSIKYHHLNNYDLNHISTENFNDIEYRNLPNAMNIALESRNIISDLHEKNIIPIVEGGSVFYIKNLLEGEKIRVNQVEENIFKDFLQLSELIIDRDNNLNLSLERIKILNDLNLKLNKTNELLKEKFQRINVQIHPNDSYRLKKKFAEEMFLYYKYSSNNDVNKALFNLSDIKIESDNIFLNADKKIEIYHFFLTSERNILNKKLENRCVDMIRGGIIKEFNYLLTNKLINENNLFNNNESNNFSTALGIHETLEFLIEFKNSEIFYPKKKAKFKNEDFHKFNSSNILSKIINHKPLIKLIYKYLKEFSSKNRKYAKKQIQFIKAKQSKVYWKEIDQNNKENFIDEILELINKPYQYYESYIESQTNINNCERISKFDEKFRDYKPEFKCLELKDEKFTDLCFLKNIIDDSLECITKNRETFTKIIFNKNNPGLNTEKNKINKDEINMGESMKKALIEITEITRMI